VAYSTTDYPWNNAQSNRMTVEATDKTKGREDLLRRLDSLNGDPNLRTNNLLWVMVTVDGKNTNVGVRVLRTPGLDAQFEVNISGEETKEETDQEGVLKVVDKAIAQAVKKFPPAELGPTT